MTEKKKSNVSGKQLYNSNLKKCKPGNPNFQPSPSIIKNKAYFCSIVKYKSSLKFTVPKYIHIKTIPKLKNNVVKKELRRYITKKCL